MSVWNKTLLDSVEHDLEAAIDKLADVKASGSRLKSLNRVYERNVVLRERGMLLRLPDPETCRLCGADSKVVDSRPFPGYRYRRHECINPSCGHRWSSYQMLVNPHRLTPRTPCTTISSG